MMSLIHLWVLSSESQQAVGSWVSSVELPEAFFLTWKSCSPCNPARSKLYEMLCTRLVSKHMHKCER